MIVGVSTDAFLMFNEKYIAKLAKQSGDCDLYSFLKTLENVLVDT